MCYFGPSLDLLGAEPFFDFLQQFGSFKAPRSRAAATSAVSRRGSFRATIEFRAVCRTACEASWSATSAARRSRTGLDWASGAASAPVFRHARAAATDDLVVPGAEAVEHEREGLRDLQVTEPRSGQGP